MQPRVFILDDESSICISLALSLEPEFSVSWQTDPALALEHMQESPPDLVLLDMVIGEYDGMEVLEKLRRLLPQTAVIMMTAYGSIRSSVSAMRQGAFTYLTKPLDIEELRIYIRQALEFQSLNENVSYLSSQLQEQNPQRNLIGKSPAIQNVLQMIEKFQDVDVNVLITGESGTGKSLAARALHDGGHRARNRFVAVNCTALDKDSLDEVFFGRKKVVQTGEVYSSPGKLDYADQGTLYLDGFADLPHSFQAKLLGVLESRSFTPVGSREHRHFDARIIVSTNQDIIQLVDSGRVRRDLFYRLNTVEIHMPPLRERKEDIPILCEHFIQSNVALQSKPCRVCGITDEAIRLLLSHDYPGNVRELINTLEYAGILCANENIRPQDLPYRFNEHSIPLSQEDHFLLGKTIQELERLAICSAYKRLGGKRNQMAEELGISPRGLWNKLKEYGLD